MRDGNALAPLLWRGRVDFCPLTLVLWVAPEGWDLWRSGEAWGFSPLGVSGATQAVWGSSLASGRGPHFRWFAYQPRPFCLLYHGLLLSVGKESTGQEGVSSGRGKRRRFQGLDCLPQPFSFFSHGLLLSAALESRGQVQVREEDGGHSITRGGGLGGGGSFCHCRVLRRGRSRRRINFERMFLLSLHASGACFFVFL